MRKILSIALFLFVSMAYGQSFKSVKIKEVNEISPVGVNTRIMVWDSTDLGKVKYVKVSDFTPNLEDVLLEGNSTGNNNIDMGTGGLLFENPFNGDEYNWKAVGGGIRIFNNDVPAFGFSSNRVNDFYSFSVHDAGNTSGSVLQNFRFHPENQLSATTLNVPFVNGWVAVGVTDGTTTVTASENTGIIDLSGLDLGGSGGVSDNLGDHSLTQNLLTNGYTIESDAFLSFEIDSDNNEPNASFQVQDSSGAIITFNKNGERDFHDGTFLNFNALVNEDVTAINLGGETQIDFGATPSNAATFTLTNISIGGYAEILYNGATEPTVTGASKFPNTASFISNTDMILCIKDFNGTRKYWFIEF